ncbi:hypothetical protein [Nocardiopsis lambiniae]|uniref:DivIVA domain-containing protein n=1 Tax=Nocardiopsis lambiniae TaxID=3075539 RepID=A0ABU2M6G2_9ACTN|nr:hypothetical protein [Nocardiopsis sp. DSM 44743]MDT0328179.1 hypothetical protein [Nocardiopsis sp. DSM 44743]
MNSPLAVPDFDTVPRGHHRGRVTGPPHRAITTPTADTGTRPHPDIPAGTRPIGSTEPASTEFDVVPPGFDRRRVHEAITDLATHIARAKARVGRG